MCNTFGTHQTIVNASEKGIQCMEHVAFSGELTISTAEELVTTLQRALQGQHALHVDLTAVEQIDTASAQVLLATKHQAVQTATVVTFSCSPAVIGQLRNLGIQL